MNETMELLHCKHCGQDKPLDEMRKDAASPTGYRAQCRPCKQQADKKRKTTSSAKTVTKSAPKKPVKASKPTISKLPAEDRLYHCNRCKRDDVPFDEMTKDKRKFMGVGSWCLICRRERDAELRAEAQRKADEVKRRADADKAAAADKKAKAKKRGHYADEWEYCHKCNAQSRPGVLRQPPATSATLYPEGALFCSRCVAKVDSREEAVIAQRRRMGIPDDASRKQLESAARVSALRELAETHSDEYRRLLARNLEVLGVEVEKKWISL